MFKHGLVSMGILTLVLVTLGCGPAATSELTPELEAQIEAHDAEVEAAERAQP